MFLISSYNFSDNTVLIIITLRLYFSHIQEVKSKIQAYVTISIVFFSLNNYSFRFYRMPEKLVSIN